MARRARREDQIRDVVGPQRSGACTRCVRINALTGVKKGFQTDDRYRGRPLDPSVFALVPEQKDLRQRGNVLVTQHGGVVEPQKTADRHQQLCARVAQDVGRLSPLNLVFSGTTTPPERSTPSAASIHSAQLGPQRATRSPTSTPAATNPRA